MPSSGTVQAVDLPVGAGAPAARRHGALDAAPRGRPGAERRHGPALARMRDGELFLHLGFVRLGEETSSRLGLSLRTAQHLIRGEVSLAGLHMSARRGGCSAEEGPSGGLHASARTGRPAGPGRRLPSPFWFRLHGSAHESRPRPSGGKADDRGARPAHVCA